MRRALLLGTLLLAAVPPGNGDNHLFEKAPVPVGRQAAVPASEKHAEPVQIEMRNVRLHVMDGVTLDIRRLRGEMQSRAAGRPPIFDDQNSYVLHVSTADMTLDMASLSNLLNRQVFAYKGSPITDVVVRVTDDGRIEQRGKLHKGVTVPFAMKTSVSAAPDGRLRLHVDSVKTLGIPTKGLLDLFGLKLDDLVDLKSRRGIEINGNDVLMSPGDVLPPPRIVGHLARAEVRDGRLVQAFTPEDGRKAPALKPPRPRANYIYFSGGNITFGKLTMAGADLQLIDTDPKDPFDFFPARYDAQLVAGYSKNTPRKGLETFMPDFDDLRRSPSGRGSGARRASPASTGSSHR